jgi:TetR/AcrR family transcriptional regulator, regulator of cefoperazone and chloramphenicol sensitivity
MSSRQSSWHPEDLTARARIRDAAVAMFGEKGFEHTTVRAIAAKAGISAALVIHHFGSKDGLRQACDDWALGIMQREKGPIIAGGGFPQIQPYLSQHPEIHPLMAYITASLRSGGVIAEQFFNRLCDLSTEMIAQGVEAGTIREPADPEAMVAVLVSYSLSASLLGDLLAHRLGGTTLLDSAVYERYSLSALELMHGGLLTDQFVVRSQESR